MQKESETPLEQRFLRLEGFASDSVLSAVAAGLPDHIDSDSRVCFVSFSYADLPIPKRFDLVFDLLNPNRAERAEVVIAAATQQFATPVDMLDHGWKTICVIAFPGGVPLLVDEMPTVDSWYESDVNLGLCEASCFTAVVANLTDTV